MSNSVFPVLPGLGWSVVKAPRWSTKIQNAVSGKEYRNTFYSYPVYSINLTYEVLREAAAYAELQTLLGFFNQRNGSYDSFLYTDPTDNTITAQLIGTGDGTTTKFQLVRTYGNNVEPVMNVNAITGVYKNDWQGNQLQYATARTNVLTNSSCDTLGGQWGLGVNQLYSGRCMAPDGTWRGIIYQGTAASPGNQYVGHAEGITLVAGVTYTASVWAKLISGSAPSQGQIITLEDNLSPNHRESIVFNGSGINNTWQRFSVTFQAQANTTGGSFYAAVDYGPGVSIAVFDAQLELGTLTSNIECPAAFISRASTATYFDVNGVMQTAAANVARYGYYYNQASATWVSGGLMLEPSVTNLLLNSATLVTQNVTVSNTPYTISFTGTGTITLSGTGAGSLVGTGSTNANMVQLTFLPTAGTLTLTVTGTVTIGQLEAGSYATSYIPTTASPVTRAADVSASAAVTVTDYAVDGYGLVTAAPAPATGGAITWTGTYYYRCRFMMDVCNFENFMHQLWALKTLDLLGNLGNKI